MEEENHAPKPPFNLQEIKLIGPTFLQKQMLPKPRKTHKSRALKILHGRRDKFMGGCTAFVSDV
jgi:hypothetical protein